MIHLLSQKKLDRLISESFTLGIRAGYELREKEIKASGKGVIIGIGAIEKQAVERLNRIN